MRFEVLKEDPKCRARAGRLWLGHGVVNTPCFMPVATLATVKMIAPRELSELGVELLVCNVYHLYLRPGAEVVESLGGLHRFMGWDRPILTDSGGFQVYSLASLCTPTPEGVRFRSPLDGSQHMLTPELVVELQARLGSDVALCLDLCPPYPVELSEAERAVHLTVDWARRSIKVARPDQVLFGIVQGATYHRLRRECAESIQELGLPGYAIGGLCLGEPPALTYELVEVVKEVLGSAAPCHLLGAGYPRDLLEGVARGVDLFDCVLPTRNGRTGTAFTSSGRILIRNARYRKDGSPLDPVCSCHTCQRFSRAYLHHLFLAGEALGPRLLTLHNLHFFIQLMRKLRAAILEEKFSSFRDEMLLRLEEEL